MFSLFKKKDSFIVLFKSYEAGNEAHYLTKEIIGVSDSQFTANRIAFGFASALGKVFSKRGKVFTRSTDLENGKIFFASNSEDGTEMKEEICIEKWTKE